MLDKELAQSKIMKLFFTFLSKLQRLIHDWQAKAAKCNL